MRTIGLSAAHTPDHASNKIRESSGSPDDVLIQVSITSCTDSHTGEGARIAHSRISAMQPHSSAGRLLWLSTHSEDQDWVGPAASDSYTGRVRSPALRPAANAPGLGWSAPSSKYVGARGECESTHNS